MSTQAELDAGHLATYKALKATGRLNEYVLHRYRCRRGCTLAIVFAVPGSVVCYVPAYRYSRGLNEQVSTPAGRAKNALDGDRRWPEHAYDVPFLAGFGGMGTTCPHYVGTIDCAKVLATVAGVIPGRPGRPTLLGTTSV